MEAFWNSAAFPSDGKRVVAASGDLEGLFIGSRSMVNGKRKVVQNDFTIGTDGNVF